MGRIEIEKSIKKRLTGEDRFGKILLAVEQFRESDGLGGTGLSLQRTACAAVRFASQASKLEAKRHGKKR